MIKESNGFKQIGEEVLNLYHDTPDRYFGVRQTQIYETKHSFITEYLQPNGEGNAPTYRTISINKRDLTLVFEDMDN